MGILSSSEKLIGGKPAFFTKLNNNVQIIIYNEHIHKKQ